MVLEERKCPNCGSGDILEKDGTFVCMSCRTFFDNPNHKKTTNINISRNETKIEQMKHKERMQKEDNKFFILGILLFLGLCLFSLIISKLF